MNLQRLVFPMLAAAVLTLAARAQEPCLPTDTPRQCFRRAVPVPVGSLPEQPAVQQAAKATESTVASFNTGADGLDAPVRSTLKDFLSVLSSNLDTAVLGGDDTRLTFGYKLPVTLLGESRQVLLETEFVKPTLSELTKSTADPATLPELEKSLTTLDDFTAGLTFTPSTRRFGRLIAPHRALFAAMFLATADSSDAAFAQALAAAGLAMADADRPFPDATVLAAFDAAARAAIPLATNSVNEQFARLLHNQPQLHATASHRFRKDIAGPREWAVRVTWEIGSQNLNGFYRHEGRDCGEHSLRPEDAGRCAAALDLYMRRTTTALTADRLALSVTYRDTEHIEKQAVVPTRALEYEVAYGRPFAAFVPGREGRIELRYKFANGLETGAIVTTPALLDAARDPEPETLAFRPTFERQAAALTYTQQVNERLSIPVSVVYTDRQHFVPRDPSRVSPPILTDVLAVNETGMSVYAGLVYRILPPRPGGKRCRCCC
jgi:hypothetical protein